MAKRDPKTGIRDIWLIDVERGQDEPLTKEPVTAGFPLWTPNGDKVVYGSTRSGPWEIYARSSDGSGREEIIVAYAYAEPFGWPRHITRDGRFC